MSWSLAGFAVEGLLGEGATGRVWSARHPSGVAVAIKTLDPERTPDRALESFEREVRHVARLDHDAIVAVLDYGIVPPDGDPRVAGSPFLVMERASGGTLADHPPADWAGARDVLARLLEGLAHAHARGVIHRDLKPSNVLRCTDDDSRAGWRLSDFGISLGADRSAVSTSRSAGTPRYMAPEQIEGRLDLHGPWTDLYAVGGLGWWLATGRAVFQGLPNQRDAHLHLAPGVLATTIAVPAGFGPFLRRLLHKDPARRFQRAADARQVLADLDGEATTRGLPEGPGRPVRPKTASVLRDAGLGLFGLRPVPFAGRQDEGRALWAALRSVDQTGRAGAVTVSGASGLGKTRLVQEQVNRAEELGRIWTVAIPHGGPADGSTTLQRLATALAALSPTVPSPPLPVEAPLALVELRQRLIARARERTLVVWLDDAQWAPDGVELARRVLDGDDLDPAPIAFVLSGEVALPVATRIALGPLSPADQLELVERMLGLDGAAASRLQQHTGGNPGFAVRVVESWVRRQLLRVTDRGLTLVPGARLSVPPDLRSAWQEPVSGLLESLSEPAVEALARLVVAGSRTSLDELPDDRAREEALDQLARRGLAVVLPGEVVLDGAVREHLLARLPAERVVALHSELADALSRAESGPDRLHRIAAHLRGAGRLDEAFELLGRILRDYVAISYREAAAAGAEAEDLGAELGLDDAALAPLRIHLSHALLGLGRLDEARLLALRAEEALPASAPATLRIELHRNLGQVAYRTRQLREATGRFEQALQIAVAHDVQSHLAAIEADLGLAVLVGGDKERGLALVASAKRRGWYGRNADFARVAFGVALILTGAPDEGERELRDVLPALEAVGHAQFLAVAHNALGEVARRRGDLDGAVRSYTAAAQHFRIAGTHRVAIAWLNLAVTHVGRGAYAEAATWAEKAASLPAIDQDLVMCALAHVCWLPCLAGLGRWEDWPKAFLEARGRLLALEGSEVDTARMLDCAAELARAAGRQAEAEEVQALAEREWARLGTR